MEKICPQCGHVNRAAGIFCAKCGARMAAPPRADSPRRRFDFFKFLGGLIRLVVTVGAVGFLVALLWPPPVPAPVSDVPRAEVFEKTVDRLLLAVEEKRPHAEVFDAHDINAYLARQLAAVDSSGTASGMTAALRQIRVDLTKDRVRVTADSAYGPARIVMAVVGRPVATEQGFSIRLEETRIGRIPVPVRYGGWIADKIRGTVVGLENERKMLAAVRQLTCEDGKIQLVVGP